MHQHWNNPRLDGVRGRIVDLDAHIMPPPDLIQRVLGEDLGQSAADLLEGTIQRAGATTFEELIEKTALEEDDADEASVWDTRSWGAFGAYDPDDRMKALDLLGIDRQFVLHTAMWDPQYITDDRAAGVCARHNDWMLDWASGSDGRLLPPAILNAHNLDNAIEETLRAIERGHRAVQLPCYGALFGGSPTNPDLDRLWAILNDASVPVVFHLFGSEGLLDYRYGAAPSLEATPMGGGGEDLGPFGMTTMHLGAELTVGAMTCSGVLERYPNLGVVVCELGAGWVGPWAERLDNACKTTNMPLENLPSESIRRQVRVTPIYGENVGAMIDTYGLEEVYAFSSDFPHKEGGKDPIERFANSFSAQQDQALENFYVGNAEKWVTA